MASFDEALTKVLKHEGVQFRCDSLGEEQGPIPGKTGYVHHPDDPGGETNYGITKAVAKSHGWHKAMEQLPYGLVKEIYREDYWEPVGGPWISDQQLAEELFDTGVNCGTKTVVRFLQRTLNVLNKKEQKYPNIIVDGVLGAKTLEALNTALGVAPWYRLCIIRALDSLQCVRYIELAEHDKKFESFVPGWLRTRVG